MSQSHLIAFLSEHKKSAIQTRKIYRQFIMEEGSFHTDAIVHIENCAQRYNDSKYISIINHHLSSYNCITKMIHSFNECKKENNYKEALNLVYAIDMETFFLFSSHFF